MNHDAVGRRSVASYTWIVLVLAIPILSSCGNSDREKSLGRWQSSLHIWDSVLHQRQARVSIREEQVARRERRVDSLLGLMPSYVYDSLLVGNWAVEMQCTSTTCDGSAIGDTRSELWRIAYVSDTLVISDAKGARLYLGTTDSSGIRASVVVPDSTATISVELHRVARDRMEGTRTINRTSGRRTAGCETVYDLRVSRAS